MRVAAVVIMLSGCWTGPDSPPPQAPKAPPVVKAPSPYATVAGTWRGIGLQYDTGEHWEIVMTLQAEADVGEAVGTIEYPSLACKASLVREPERDGMLVMSEKMTDGAGTCVDGGTIRIPRAPKDSLDWRWFFPSGEEGAKSEMSR